MDFSKKPLLWLVPAWLMVSGAEAVILRETGDTARNTTTPGDNSGWQYEGKFNMDIGGGNFNRFLGIPIAPYFFITAQHIGGTVGDILDFHGDPYTTIAVHNVPSTDLRIWEVNHAKPFPTYAPVSSGISDLGAMVTVFGRGTQRGGDVMVSGVLKGWYWDAADNVLRWGRNMVTNTPVTASGLGEFLYCEFDNPGIADECHLSVGDSGGGMFVLENGLWRLAGIHYAVDGPFRIPPAGASFIGALFDCGGLEYHDGTNWVPIADGAQDVPSGFYSSRVSASLPWIRTNIGTEVDSLPSENFSAWRKLYFTPAEIATPATSGPLADPDSDGIANLLEFALNLDPAFNERAVMAPGTGLRGLPMCRVETTMGADRLTMEFVRRTSGSGAGLTYIPEYSSDLVSWQAVGTESTTSLNPRWERVKITDSLSTNDTVKRFVRLRVVVAE